MNSVQVQFGKEVRNLRFDFAAMVALEQTAGKPWADVLSELSRSGFNATRLVIWAGLRWEDKRLSVDAVSDMLQEYLQEGGTLEAVAVYVSEALKLSGLFGDKGNGKAGAEK